MSLDMTEISSERQILMPIFPGCSFVLVIVCIAFQEILELFLDLNMLCD